MSLSLTVTVPSEHFPPEPFPSKPPKKKALLIAIRHVHSRTGTNVGSFADLEFAHRDAQELRDSLIALHGYHVDDIILMMDDKNHPQHLWPTYGRILHQIDLLVSDAAEDSHFFFYYSGHGLEVEASSHARAVMRADGRDDEIFSADGKPILDYILHDRLIKPLQNVKRSKLFVLLDCCHSETLLDLQRGSGPNSYSRQWNIGPGQLFKDVSIFLSILSDKCKHNDTPPVPGPTSPQVLSTPTYKPEEGKLRVICLSPCRDGQIALDDRDLGLTFTKCFINIMKEQSGPITWAGLRDALKESVSKIWTNYQETCSQGPSSGRDRFYRLWTQDPRFCTSPHTDLTRVISL